MLYFQMLTPSPTLRSVVCSCTAFTFFPANNFVASLCIFFAKVDMSRVPRKLTLTYPNNKDTPAQYNASGFQPPASASGYTSRFGPSLVGIPRKTRFFVAIILNHEPRHEKNCFLHMRISCSVIDQCLCFRLYMYIVQSLFFINPKFKSL